MILAMSLLGGALIGYLKGSGRAGLQLFLPLWLIVLAVQTTYLYRSTDSVRDRDTGAWDPAYAPVAVGVLLLGLVVLNVAARVRRRREGGA